MADTNRNQRDDRWQNRDDRYGQNDRSRDDYSSNYGNTQGTRYGGEDYRSDAPYRSSNYNSSYNRGERSNDYSDFERVRDRSVNPGTGYDPYNYGQTVGSFNQGKEGSYSSRREERGYAPGYDRMFDNDSGYDSDYNRSYGQRPQDKTYGTGSYYGNNYRDRYESRNDQNMGDWKRDRSGYSHTSGDRGWWDKTTDEVASWFGDDDAERRREADRRMGPHRGKGPKGYTRSDERIKDDVNDRLSDDSFIDASDIDVTCEHCEIVLTGTVDNKEEKRRAEDIAERVSGVKNVENRLKVRSRENTGGATIYRDRD
jgi:osmotically-inducible protein OsmY